MSFSFSTVKSTKAEVQADVDAKISEIAEQQTAHIIDRDVVSNVVAQYLEIIDDRVEGVIHVSVSGSVSWNETGAEGARMRVFNGASVNVSVRKAPVA